MASTPKKQGEATAEQLKVMLAAAKAETTKARAVATKATNALAEANKGDETEDTSLSDFKKNVLTKKNERLSMPAGKFLVTFNIPSKKTTLKQTAVVNRVIADQYKSKMEKGNRKIVSVEQIT